jgi:hypothetical protein
MPMHTPEDILRKALGGADEEPHPGHEQRFARRLAQQHDDRKVRHIPSWLWIASAAASVAALIIVLVVSEIRKTNEAYSRMRLSDVNYEMAQVEAFYEKRLNEKTPVLNNSDEMIARLQLQLKSLEGEYTSLEVALAQTPGNAQIVDAMVSNYKYRLHIVELIQRYVDISNNVKKKQDESIDL